MWSIVLMLACGRAPIGTTTASTGTITATGDWMVVSDADRDSVWTRSMTGRSIHDERILTGGPGRMARDGEDLWVVLEHSGELAHLSLDEEGALTLHERTYVGAGPFDVAVARPGEILVSLAQEGAVLRLDGLSMEVLDRYTVGGEPRWLSSVAPHRGSGPRVFVSRADQPLVVEVHLGSGERVEHPLPALPRFDDVFCTQRELVPSITGALAVDAVNDQVYVPVAYVDTKLVEDDNNLRLDCGFPIETLGAYYAPVFDSELFSRITPAIVGLETAGGEAGTPTVVPLYSASEEFIRGLPGDVLLSYDPWGQASASVAFTNERLQATVTLFDLEDLGSVSMGVTTFREIDEGVVSWAFNEEVGEVVGWGPRARALVQSQVDPSGFGALRVDLVDTVPSPVPEAVLRGRALFDSATDYRVVGARVGMSCSVCHPDGGTDGRTWQFVDFPRQTPTLAGGVSSRAPFTWLGTVETVEDEALATSRERLGGAMAHGDAGDITAYLASVRPRPRRDLAPDIASRVESGKEIFHRSEVGCATCHSGTEGSDNTTWAVFDFEEATMTPHLAGVGSTAPYLHDGSAKTLMDVLERARDGSMGDTSSLSADEMLSLEAYLRHW